MTPTKTGSAKPLGRSHEPGEGDRVPSRISQTHSYEANRCKSHQFARSITSEVNCCDAIRCALGQLHLEGRSQARSCKKVT